MPENNDKNSIVGRPFQKGKSGNPGGRPKIAESEKAARNSERSEIAEMWPRIKGLPIPELAALAKRTDAPAIEVAMASAIMHAIKRGDLSEVHRFYDRLLGKPKQQLEHVGEDGPLRVVVEYVR